MARLRDQSCVGWICRRCGLGLICEDEPGNCGCYSGPPDVWDYERVELVSADALRDAIELLDADSFNRGRIEPLRELLRNLARIEAV